MIPKNFKKVIKVTKGGSYTINAKHNKDNPKKNNKTKKTEVANAS